VAAVVFGHEQPVAVSIGQLSEIGVGHLEQFNLIELSDHIGAITGGHNDLPDLARFGPVGLAHQGQVPDFQEPLHDLVINRLLIGLW